MEILQFITDRGAGITSIVTGVITLCSIITASTKTPGKTAKVTLAYKLVEIMALNIGRAKQKSE